LGVEGSGGIPGGLRKNATNSEGRVGAVHTRLLPSWYFCCTAALWCMHRFNKEMLKPYIVDGIRGWSIPGVRSVDVFAEFLGPNREILASSISVEQRIGLDMSMYGTRNPESAWEKAERLLPLSWDRRLQSRNHVSMCVELRQNEENTMRPNSGEEEGKNSLWDPGTLRQEAEAERTKMARFHKLGSPSKWSEIRCRWEGLSALGTKLFFCDCLPSSKVAAKTV